MIIMGINAFHADSSACIVKDGIVEVAIEEERLRRIKHWAGFPSRSIETCLEYVGISIVDVDIIAVNRSPNAHLAQKLFYTIKNRPSLSNVFSKVKNRKELADIPELLASNYNMDKSTIKKKFVPVEHHIAHLASSYYTSPFNESVILSIDGFGDFVSTMWGYGNDSSISVNDYVGFPHSLGLFYMAITQFLGFWKYGDEYKVMGMTGYGKPIYLQKMHQIVNPIDDGKFELDADFFIHHSRGITMEWEDGYPIIGQVFSQKMIEMLGEPRAPEEKVTQRHKDIAASLQKAYENILFHILTHQNKTYSFKKLCLSGGCAQNSVANGKITSKTNFNKVWVQPAAGDAGGALGAALYVYAKETGFRPKSMVSPALGISYYNDEIERVLAEVKNKEQFTVKYYHDESELIEDIVFYLTSGCIVGFFHGRFEWGPRALGNRSILVDPRIEGMRDLLNRKIKKRESFRPFAPSVLRECVPDWFEKDEDVPFMTHVFNIRKDKQKLVPAITHIDGTGRLQSVTKDFNSRYYRLIKSFYEKTGIPMVLNTSFNENEPIVNTPQEGMDCFLRTDMDALVLEDYLIRRK